MNKEIIIIGASGHGKVVADIAEKSGYSDILFLDDNSAVKKCDGYRVTGKCEDAGRYKNSDFFVAIGNAAVRQKIQTRLADSGFHIVSLIHPNAVVAASANIGAGTVVMAGAVINPGASIGKGCIINTCASVDHDCVIGDFVHVSVGSHIAGTVTVGDNTWIGAGATVSNNIEIAKDCMIGAGAVVVHDLMESDTYIGIPARKMDRKHDRTE